MVLQNIVIDFKKWSICSEKRSKLNFFSISCKTLGCIWWPDGKSLQHRTCSLLCGSYWDTLKGTGKHLVHCNKLRWEVNAFQAAGECIRWQVKNLTNVVKYVKIVQFSWPYLEPQWKMHSDKYKHAWYVFINLWYRHWHFIHLRRQSKFCSVKPGVCCVLYFNWEVNESTVDMFKTKCLLPLLGKVLTH